MKKPSEQIAGQSTLEGKTEQLRFFIPPALQDRSKVGWKQPVFEGATDEQRFLISLQKQGVKFRPMETFEGDWMCENNLARFYARYQEADTILKQREKERAEFGVQLESDLNEEIEMIITELMRKDKMWQIERERGLSTLEGERKVEESFRQMFAENQAVLDEMARDKEECRINEKAVDRTKDQDKEYVELDEVLIVSEKQGAAEEETQKEKESAQVGNLQSKKDAETSFIQSSELKTLKKESNQEPGKFQMHDPVSHNCAVSMSYTYIILPHILNSTELHLQGVAPRSQYSDHTLEAVKLQ